MLKNIHLSDPMVLRLLAGFIELLGESDHAKSLGALTQTLITRSSGADFRNVFAMVS